MIWNPFAVEQEIEIRAEQAEVFVSQCSHPILAMIIQIARVGIFATDAQRA